METEHLLFNDNELNPISSAELEEDDLQTVDLYVECTRHIMELHGLLLSFLFNIKELQKRYTLLFSGTVIADGKPADTYDDYIVINALTTSIISAGVTLTNALQSYITAHLTEEGKDNYVSFCSNIYDNVFEYRLMVNMRNFAQHGHLPVDLQNHKYCFDLHQFMTRPHFHIKSSFKEEINAFAEEIIRIYEDTPTFSYTSTLARYVEKVLLIYKQFYEIIKDQFEETYKKSMIIINNYPEGIAADKTTFIYKNDKGEEHVILSFDQAMETFFENCKAANKYWEEYKEAADNIFDGTIALSFKV